MTTKAASSVAYTKPTDVVAAVDARNKTAGKPLAKAPASAGSKIGGFFESLSTRVSESGLNASDLGNVISINDGKLGFDPRVAGGQIDQIAGVGISGIATSDNVDIKTKALQNMAALYGDKDIINILTDTGNSLKIQGGTDTGSAKSLANAIQRLVGDTRLGAAIDQNSYLSTGYALLEGAIALGMPEMIDTLKEKFEKDQEAKKRLIASVKSVILRGDLDTLDKIMGWVGVDGVLAKVPDVVYLLVAAYTFPPGTKPENYLAEKTKLFAMLARFNPTWWLTKRAGVDVFNLEIFTRASFNAVTLFNLETVDDLRGPGVEEKNRFLMPTLVAPNYRPVEITELALKKYPKLGLWR